MSEIHTINHSFGFLQRAFADFIRTGNLFNFHNYSGNISQSHDQFALNSSENIRSRHGLPDSSLLSNSSTLSQLHYSLHLEGHIFISSLHTPSSSSAQSL